MLFIIAQISINLLHSIIKIIFHYKERIGKRKAGKFGGNGETCNAILLFYFISLFHFV